MDPPERTRAEALKISQEDYYNLQLLINVASHLATTLNTQLLFSLAAIILDTNCADYNSHIAMQITRITHLKQTGHQVLTRLRPVLLGLLHLSTLLDYHNTEGPSATNPQIQS